MDRFGARRTLLLLASLFVSAACGGESSSPLSISPDDVTFGEVYVGASNSRRVTLTNTSSDALTITSVSPVGTGLVTSGDALPTTLSPGESTNITVEFAPSKTGTVDGAVSVTTDATGDSATILRNVAKAVLPTSALTVSPASIAFGDVTVGASDTRVVTITNASGRAVTLTGLSVTGRDVSASGLIFPTTLATGETAQFSVAFAPTRPGQQASNIALWTAHPHPVAFVAVGANAVSAVSPPPAALDAFPAALNFQDVTVGSFSAQSVTLTNSSDRAITITELATTGDGSVTASGLELPVTVAPGSTVDVAVTFTPGGTGSVGGTLSVLSADQPAPLAVVDYDATAIEAAHIASLTVDDVAVPVGHTAQLIANVAASGTIDKSVTWSVESGSLGTVDPSTGLYTAPAVAGTYRVWATSNFDPSKRDDALVTVTAAPAGIASVTVGDASVTAGQKVQMIVSVAASGTIDTSVTWSVAAGSLGTIDPLTGVYTAPAAAGTYRVWATSNFDPSKKDAGDIVVTAVPAAITSLTVNDAIVSAGGQVQMTATVLASGTIDRAVTWSVDGGSLGTIDRNTGVYTAPSAAGTYTVWATSNADPARKDAGTVTVTVPAPSATPGDPATASTVATCSGLVSHTNPVTRPSLAMPGYNASDPSASWAIDPVFGTKISRVTGNPGDAIPGLSGRTWKTTAGPLYPKTPAWNADGSLLMVMGVDSGFLIVDGNTYKPLVFRGGVPGYSVPDFRWHPRDPRYFVVVETGGKVGLFNPIDNTVAWKFDPGVGVFRGASIGFAEGNVSNDGNRVAVTATRVSDGRTVVFGVDLALGRRISPVIAAEELGMPTFDWATISPLGNYILASSPWTPGLNRTIRLDGSCATTFTSACVVATWYHMGHYDVGLLDDGTTQVAFNAGEPAYVRLDDPSGARVYLAGAGYGNYYHSSTRNVGVPGWGFASLDWTGGALNGEIFAQELRGGGRVRRFAYTYRSSTTAYEHQTNAVPSPDGTRVFFRSDWGNASGPVYGFIADARELCD